MYNDICLVFNFIFRYQIPGCISIEKNKRVSYMITNHTKMPNCFRPQLMYLVAMYLDIYVTNMMNHHHDW